MKQSFKELGKYRILSGPYASYHDDHFGAFVIKDGTFELLVIVDDGEQTGWEHVSVSCIEVRKGNRCPRIPSWNQMCFIKKMFWDKEECVIQFHPPESEYVNQCANCLHLWKPTHAQFPTPPKILVGFSTENKVSVEDVPITQ